nr:hypothetical protein [Tanacetum cinerariifolium]
MPITRQGANDAMTPESIQAMIDQAIQRNYTHTQEDASQNSSGGPRRPGTEGVVGLSQWVKKMESVFHISGCAVENQYLAAGGNTFPELRDNIQGYVSAAAVNYNQCNSGYRPLGMANRIRPPGSLPSNTVANPKGELKAITSRSGLVLDGPSVLTPEDERVEKTLTDQDLSEYTIKLRMPRITTLGIQGFNISLDYCYWDFLGSLRIFLIKFLLLEMGYRGGSGRCVEMKGILIHETPFKIITPIVQDKKLAISNASLVIEDCDPPLYELSFFKEVPRSKMLLSFSSENEEKVFKPEIHTSGKVRSSLITELSHQGYKVFKINQIFKSSMKIFLFSCGKDTHILVVPCLYFYPLDQLVWGNWVKLSDLK